MAGQQFDYVVVGAGSAGCVLANRLSADPDRRVALLEAGGPDRSMNIRIPAAFTKLFTTPYDWNYRTGKQAEPPSSPPASPYIGGRRIPWCSGF